MGILGIDPGLSGGLALVTNEGVTFTSMPTIEGLLDLQALKDWFTANHLKIGYAYLEKVHAMPGQGVSSVFKFGRVYGAIEAYLAAFSIPYELVTPQRWMKAMHTGIEGSLDSKARSQMAIQRLYPKLDLRESPRCRKPHEGIVEAILIAEYGRKRQIGAILP